MGFFLHEHVFVDFLFLSRTGKQSKHGERSFHLVPKDSDPQLLTVSWLFTVGLRWFTCPAPPRGSWAAPRVCPGGSPVSWSLSCSRVPAEAFPGRLSSVIPPPIIVPPAHTHTHTHSRLISHPHLASSALGSGVPLKFNHPSPLGLLHREYNQ